jgi:uncharacterized protein
MSDAVIHRLISPIVISILLLLGTGEGAAERLTAYVTDRTHLLEPAEIESLNRTLATFERETSTQIVVLMVPSLAGGSIEEEAWQIARENQIGQKGKNNGVLLYIARDDRKLRIEVGYGLEGVLTDALSNQIIRKEITPYFKVGQFYEGIRSGVEAIMLATKDEYHADKPNGAPEGFGLVPFIIIGIIFVFLSRLRRRRFIGSGVPPIFFGGGFGGGSGGFGGGGFSGGGGSFGGGGSSGSW